MAEKKQTLYITSGKFRISFGFRVLTGEIGMLFDVNTLSHEKFLSTVLPVIREQFDLQFFVSEEVAAVLRSLFNMTIDAADPRQLPMKIAKGQLSLLAEVENGEIERWVLFTPKE